MRQTSGAFSGSITVARILAPLRSLGPGVRIGLWLPGCQRSCPGCISPSLSSPTAGKPLDIQSLGQALAGALTSYSGVTFTGGEPFYQYVQLVLLCTFIRQLGSWDIGVYTGYTMEELLDAHPDRAFLNAIDWLVDGEYQSDLADSSGWRGSSNQRLFRISEGRPVEVKEGFDVGPWSVASCGDHQAYFAGIPGQGTMERLQEELKKNSINMELS